jgi:hypothetical protein
MTQYTYTADSWDEFVSDLKHKPHLPEWEGNQASITGKKKFTQTDSFNQSMRLAEQGCPTTREAIHQASFKVMSEALPEWDTAPVGVFPCIPAFAAGVPTDMFTPSEFGNPVPKPIVRIVVNVTATCNVPTAQIVNRGAAILSLIDRVQATGQRVELVAEFHCTSGSDTFAFSVTVKRPEEPVDLDRIAYAIAHPSMLRRSLFRVMEFTAPYVVCGYGNATDLNDRVSGGDVYIKSMLHGGDGFETRDRAKTLIQAVWDKAAEAA